VLPIQEALSAVNQSSVLEWAAQFPRLSVVELAKQLSGRIAPISLQQEMVKEARERGTFPQLARALLVRLLIRDFPRGYGSVNPEDAQSALASGFSVWMLIFDPDQRAAAEAVWSSVVAELEAHPDWVPEHGDEPRLLKLFSGRDLTRSKRAALVARARERIETALHGQRSNKAWLEALASLPPGHGFIHAAGWVDSEVRNGGFLQYLKNTAGVELPLAITALTAMGRTEIASLLQEALATTREHHRHLLAPGLTTEPVLPVIESPRSLAQLDKAYFALPHDLFESFASLIEAAPHFFEPPFRQLQHREDGRKWRVRTSGAAIEIEIELDDGTSITRTRQCATASRAEQEVQTLINEQLADGFVDVA
jgi:hypothetical protein